MKLRITNPVHIIPAYFAETGSHGFLNTALILRVTKTSDGYLKVTFKDLTQSVIHSDELLRLLNQGFVSGEGIDFYDRLPEYQINMKDVSNGRSRVLNILGLLYFYPYDSAPFGRCIVAKEYDREEIMCQGDFAEFTTLLRGILNR